MLIHFYSPIDKKTIKKIEKWNIEKEYYKFGHGVGHNIFEFYKRLKILKNSSIGPEIPDNCDIVIIFSKHFNNHSDFLKLKKLNCKVIRIFSDDRPKKFFFIKNLINISPYSFDNKKIKNHFNEIDSIYHIRTNNYTWIPAFIQRGIKSRKSKFSKKKLNLGFFGNKHNIPKFLNKKKLLKLSFNLKINETPKKWNNYSNIHIAICAVTSDDKLNKFIKPPTKTLNAISANVIPLANNILANKIIIKNYVNGFIYNNEKSFYKILKYISNNQHILKKINKTNEVIRGNYNNNMILDYWLKLFEKKNKHIKISNLIYICIFLEKLKKLLKSIFKFFKTN